LEGRGAPSRIEENAVEYYREKNEDIVHDDTEIVYRVAPDAVGPHVEQHHEKGLAAVPHSRKAYFDDQEEVDAIRLPCFSEPGVDAARELCDNLVMSGPYATFHIASMLGHSFSVIIAGMGRSETKVRQLVTKYGLESRLASVRTLDLPPTGMNPTQITTEELREIQKNALEQARRAIEEDGAEVIIGYSGAYEYLDENRDVPVLDPIAINIKITEALTELGLDHNKLGYPTPRIPHTYYLSEEPSSEK